MQQMVPLRNTHIRTTPLFRVALFIGLTIVASSGNAQETPAPPAAKSSPAALAVYADAANYQNNDAFELAIDEWKKFTKRFPNDPLASKAQYYLGVCQLQLKQHAASAGSFQTLIEQFPKFEQLETAYLNLGWCQYTLARAGDASQYPKAAETFQKLATSYPDFKDTDQALFFLGESLYSMGKKQESTVAYEKLATDHPKSSLRSEVLYALGVTFEEIGEFKKAGATYTKFLTEFPSSELKTEITMRKAETILRGGNPGEAEKLFAMVASTEGFAEADLAMLRQAYCAARQEKNTAAAAVYSALLQRFPESDLVPDAQLSAGRCYYRANEYDRATAHFEQSIAVGGKQSFEAAHWLSRILLRKNEAVKVVELLSKTIPTAKNDPFLPNLRLDYADALFATKGRRADALQEYLGIVQTYPDHGVTAESLYGAAFTALDLKNFEQALELVGQFTAKFPDHTLVPDVSSVAAECHLQEKKYKEAELAYRSLLEKHPKHAELNVWRNRLGLALYLQKDYQSVIDLLSRLSDELKPPAIKAESKYLIGICQFQLGQTTEATESLRASLLTEPKWREADATLLYLARAQYKLGQFDQALVTLSTLNDSFPSSSHLDQAAFRQGECYYATGKYDDAVAAYDRLLKTWPTSSYTDFALYGKGWSELKSQKFDLAEAEFSTLLEKSSNKKLCADATFARGMCRRQLKNYEATITDINQYLGTSPDAGQRADALYERALAEVGAEQHQQAIDTFSTLLNEKPDYATADKILYEMAWSYTSLKNQDRAVESFSKLTAEHPDSKLAAEAFFHVGEDQYAKKDFAAAVASYTAAVDKATEPEIREKALYKLGWTQYQLQQFQPASANFQRQLDQFPEGPLAGDARFMKAETSFKLKDYEAAYTAFVAAVKEKSSSPEMNALKLLHGGQSAAQLGKWKETQSMLTSLISDFPDSAYLPEAYFERGQACRKLDNFDEASKDFRRAAEQSRGEVGARALFMLGELEFQNKQYDQAIKNYQRVMFRFVAEEAGPEVITWQAKAGYEAARCAEVQIQDAATKPEQKKRIAEAKRFYRYVVEKHPNSNLAPEAKKRLEALTKL